MMRFFLALCLALPTGCTRGSTPELVPVATKSFDASTPLSPTGYVQFATSTELFELEASHLALYTSQNPEVLRFAAQLIRQHTASHDRLGGIATGLGLTFPTEMRPQEQLRLVQLRRAGADFDAAFRHALIIVLTQQIGFHQNYATLGTVAALRAEAVAATLLARQHLRAAYALNPLPPAPPPEEKPLQL